MSSEAGRSLLDYLGAPVVVGDPDGNSVYLNSSFEMHFQSASDDSMGCPLANLFEGGAREAVLGAVAGVCGGSGTVRFHLREGDTRYAAVASPIVSGSDRVGVVILFTPELAGDEQMLSFYRGVQDELDEITRCLMGLSRGGDVGPDSTSRSLVEDGIRALERIRKRSEAIDALVRGQSHSH
jgi:hypothetical protein